MFDRVLNTALNWTCRTAPEPTVSKGLIFYLNVTLVYRLSVVFSTHLANLSWKRLLRWLWISLCVSIKINKNSSPVSHVDNFSLSHQMCTIKIDVPKSFAKFTRKNLCQSLFSTKLQAWDLQLCWKRRYDTGNFLLILRNC